MNRVLRSAKDCFLRHRFNRSALVRQLAGWQAAQADAPRQNVAERLADWLNVADAITLHAAHRSMAAVNTVKAQAVPGKAGDLNAECAQVRTTLAKAIATRPFNLSVQQPAATAADFPLFQQRYLDQQRRMEMRIEALRAHVRQTLSLTSPPLAQLAALDAVLAQMLAGREQKLLGSVPSFLKARFKDLYTTRASADDNRWLDTFEHDFQQTLLAELDLRLQPIVGMVEAFAQHAGAPTPHVHPPIS